MYKYTEHLLTIFCLSTWRGSVTHVKKERLVKLEQPRAHNYDDLPKVEGLLGSLNSPSPAEEIAATWNV